MRMLLAVDLKDQPQRLVAEAARWAAPLDATIDLVYADGYLAAASIISDPQVQVLVEDESRKIRARERETLEQLRSGMPEARRGEAHVIAGDPVDVVLELAESYDVVAVGTNGRTGLQRFWLGSVAERIVRLVPRTVIVLRPQET